VPDETLRKLRKLEAEAQADADRAVEFVQTVKAARIHWEAVLGEDEVQRRRREIRRRNVRRIVVIPAAIGAGVAAARAARESPKTTVAVAGAVTVVAATAIALSQLGGGHGQHGPYYQARPKRNVPATAPPARRPPRPADPVGPDVVSLPSSVTPSIVALPPAGGDAPGPPDMPSTPAPSLPSIPTPPVKPTPPLPLPSPVSTRHCLLNLRPTADIRLVCRRG
jgi:hypothetical protein